MVGVLNPSFRNGSSFQKLGFMWSESFLIVWRMNALLCYVGVETLTSVRTCLHMGKGKVPFGVNAAKKVRWSWGEQLCQQGRNKC